METKVNKAQEKRDRQNTEFVDFNLRRKLQYFENNYLNSAVRYAFTKLNKEIANTEQLIKDFPNREITERNKRDRVENHEHRLKQLKHVLSLDAKITLETITEAKKSYDEKVNRLVELLVKEGFGYAKFKIEEIANLGGELEFLISKDDKEVHARLIFVNGVIVTPHFRFITTVRQK